MLEELFESINSEVLTETVRLQLATLFEASLNEAIKEKESQLEEDNRVEITEFKENLSNQVSEYLDYIVEEFVKENEEEINDHIKVNTAKKVLEAFTGIMEQFNMEISDEKIEESVEIDELTKQNNKLMAKLQEAKRETELVKKAAFISEAMQEIEVESKQDKFLKIAEGLEFDEDTFERKLNVIVEQLNESTKEVPTQTQITEESLESDIPEKVIEELDESKSDEEVVESKQISESMQSYLKKLRK